MPYSIYYVVFFILFYSFSHSCIEQDDLDNTPCYSIIPPSTLQVIQNNSKIGEYNFPTPGCPTVPPLLLSRPLLLRLCNAYLLAGNYKEGVELLERVFFKIHKAQENGYEDPTVLFAMHGQLMTSDLKDVFTDAYPDHELVMYYVKFLVLVGDATKAVFLLSCLPHGMKYEPDFLILNAYLTNVMVCDDE